MFLLSSLPWIMRTPFCGTVFFSLTDFRVLCLMLLTIWIQNASKKFFLSNLLQILMISESEYPYLFKELESVSNYLIEAVFCVFPLEILFAYLMLFHVSYWLSLSFKLLFLFVLLGYLNRPVLKFIKHSSILSSLLWMPSVVLLTLFMNSRILFSSFYGVFVECHISIIKCLPNYFNCL